MAIVRNRPGAVVRRITTWSLVTDVVVAFLVGALISQVVGVILFLVGLVVTGVFALNARRVLKTRGY